MNNNNKILITIRIDTLLWKFDKMKSPASSGICSNVIMRENATAALKINKIGANVRIASTKTAFKSFICNVL